MRQSNTNVMLKVEGSNLCASVYNVYIYLGIIGGSVWTIINLAFGTCRFTTILIDCIRDRYTNQVLDWA